MKLGDFELDNVYLGDCYELIKRLPDNSVDLIYTDVPYDVEDNGGGGALVKRSETITPNMSGYVQIPIAHKKPKTR